jgi:hypothetical protein
MAVTTGFVQRFTWLKGGPTACVWVGSSPSPPELLFIQILPADNASTVAFKRAMVGLLVKAQVNGRELDVGHPDGSAEVTSVATTSCNPNQTPLQLDAIEITQAVQDLAQAVPLIARKRTVVRVYLSNYASAPAIVRGELRLRRGPSDPPLILPSLNTTVLDQAQAGNPSAARTDATRSLNFVLPDSHTGPGPLAISIADVTDVVSGNPIAFGCDCRPSVWFHASPPLRVRIVGFRYTQGMPPVTYTPTNLDFQMLLSWLGRAYPVSQVLSSTGLVDATAPPPFGCGDINAQLAALRALDMSSGGDQRTHYYGLVSDGGFFMRGCAGVPYSTPDPSAVGSGPTGPGTWGWDFDGTYGDWYGGHELGHTYGRLHPGFCGETQDDLLRYPFAHGQLANTDSSFVGFDVGDPVLNLPLTALRGTQWHDVMTYCNYQWLSSYTYQGIRLRLLAEAALPASTGPGAPSPGGGGRPDERYPGPARIEQTAAESAAGETMISVVARVNLTKRQGKIQYVHPVPGASISHVVDESPVSLRVVEQGDRRSPEYPVEVRLNSELSPADDREGLVDAVVPVTGTARAVELLIGGDVVDTFEPARDPPAIRALRAVGTDADGVRMAVESEQPIEQSQSYAVQVSSDGGRSWQTIGVGLREPTFTLDRAHFQEGRDVEVRVIATNGFTSREVRHESLRLSS